jgi:hypothetical protein
MSDLDDDQRALIPHSLRELSLHCIYKGIQLGSTVTLLTSLPYQLYKSRKHPSLITILSRVGTTTFYASITGVILSIGMMHIKLYKENYSEYQIWDRAYRLRYSQTQNRVDKLTLYSSIIGGITGFIIGLPRKFNPISAGKGALMAIPFGILGHLIIKPLEQTNISKNEK